MLILLCSCFSVETLDTALQDTSSSQEEQDSFVESEESIEDTGEWPESPWVTIAAGNWHTCAVSQQKETVCWGRDLEGQSTPPTGIPFRSLTGGWFFTCGLAFDSRVHCWGDISFDILSGRYSHIAAGKDFLCGISRVDHSIECTNLDVVIPSGSFVQVDAGFAHVCAITDTQEVLCFGDNGEGQCDVPAGIFDKVQAGFYHSCAKNGDGISCWGGAQDGATSIPLVQENGIWTGNFHNCTRNDNQQAVCWGGDSLNLSGGIVGAKFTDLALGGFHSCGITTEDTIFCSGENTQGQTDFPND